MTSCMIQSNPFNQVCFASGHLGQFGLSAAVTLVGQKQLVQEGWGQPWLAAPSNREPESAHQQLSLLPCRDMEIHHLDIGSFRDTHLEKHNFNCILFRLASATI